MFFHSCRKWALGPLKMKGYQTFILRGGLSPHLLNEVLQWNTLKKILQLTVFSSSIKEDGCQAVDKSLQHRSGETFCKKMSSCQSAYHKCLYESSPFLWAPSHKNIVFSQKSGYLDFISSNIALLQVNFPDQSNSLKLIQKSLTLHG